MKKNDSQVETYGSDQTTLELSEFKYKALFNNMSSGVVIYRATDDGDDFVILDFNRAAERIEKVSKENVIGRKVTEVFPGVNEFGLFGVLKRVYKTGGPEHYPIGQYKDQRIMGWRENYVYKLPSGEVVAIYDDVTERKRAELALELSEQCFHAIADYSCFWEVWVNPAGKVVWTNPAVEEITGYSIKEIMAMKDYPMPLVYEKDKGKVGRAFRSAVDGSKGRGFRFRLRRKDDSVIGVEMSWQSIYDKHNISIGHRESIRPVTENN